MNEALEAAIDAAGRDLVFARARSHGWKDGGAPEWVWWRIVCEIRNGDPPPYNPPDGILDFLGL